MKNVHFRKWQSKRKNIYLSHFHCSFLILVFTRSYFNISLSVVYILIHSLCKMLQLLPFCQINFLSTKPSPSHTCPKNIQPGWKYAENISFSSVTSASVKTSLNSLHDALGFCSLHHFSADPNTRRQGVGLEIRATLGGILLVGCTQLQPRCLCLPQMCKLPLQSAGRSRHIEGAVYFILK